MSAKTNLNGGLGIRILARNYSAEAIERCVRVMRTSDDDYAVAFACYAIVMAALSHPAHERLEEPPPKQGEQ